MVRRREGEWYFDVTRRHKLHASRRDIQLKEEPPHYNVEGSQQGGEPMVGWGVNNRKSLEESRQREELTAGWDPKRGKATSGEESQRREEPTAG